MITMNKQHLLGGAPGDTCVDCIFWYQCRQGKVDCQAGQKIGALPRRNMNKAPVTAIDRRRAKNGAMPADS